MKEEIYFISKFTHVLGEKYEYRESDPKNRTDDDNEILQLKSYDKTEFGIQGALDLWNGSGNDYDWEKNADIWEASVYFFEFQTFLEFYTAPTKDKEISKFILFTPSHDWTSFQSVEIEEIHFNNADFGDLEDPSVVAELICILLNEKYRVTKVSKNYLKKYLEK
jgi:hypothetical protein